jgi:hypothetical protein
VISIVGLVLKNKLYLYAHKLEIRAKRVSLRKVAKNAFGIYVGMYSFGVHLDRGELHAPVAYCFERRGGGHESHYTYTVSERSEVKNLNAMGVKASRVRLQSLHCMTKCSLPQCTFDVPFNR